MAGTARLSSRNAASIAPPPSSANGQARQGFGYQDMAPISNFPSSDALLRVPRRAMDHRPLPFPSQQQQREMAMKRRISEEMERERERERALLLERGRADRLLIERAARIAGGVGVGGVRMYEGNVMLPPIATERPAVMFPDKRMDGAGILGSNASFPGLDRRAEMHMGSSLHMDTALDRGFDKVQPLKALEKHRTYDRRAEIDMGSPLHAENAMDKGFDKMEATMGQDKPRIRDNLRVHGMVRGMENPGVMDIPRGMENSRMLENVRGAEVPKSAENFRLSDTFRVPDIPSALGFEQLRAMNPRAMELVGGNSRSLESPEHYRSLESTDFPRDNSRSSEISRVANKPLWGLDNSKRSDSPLATTNTTGLERRIDNVSTSNRGFDASSDEGNDRNGFKPSLRRSSHDRKRLMEQKQEDDDGRDKIEKPTERPPEDTPIQELVAQYKMALAELTFNSKPIITNLTIIAGENLHASKAIASTVCSHILEVPVEQKLPALYLLDSIVKNISSSYVKHFAARLPEVFIRSYRQVDPTLYPAMQHLFKTWRGVFNIEPLREIERELQLNILGNGPLFAAPPSNSARSNNSSPLQQRPGHGIHVNPKYLEAQRQKLQQSSQFPSRTERDDGVAEEAATLHKSALSLPEFDYSTLGDKGGINVERKNAWDMGLPIREEDTLREMESRYGVRNGYDIQPQSPRALIDAYGNVRGVRASRLPPAHVQPADELDSRDRDQARDWQSAEEEEYSWGDVNTRLLDVGEISRRDKDDWLHGDADKSLLPGPLSASEPQASGHTSWGKHGAWSGADRPASAEDLGRRDVEERASLRDLRPLEETPAMGLKGHSFVGHRPLAGRIPHPPMEHLSPPPQSWQPHSSQQPMSVHPRLPPLIPQLFVKPSGVLQPPLLVQQTMEHSPEQPSAQSGPAPVLLQIPSKLLESLQQLQRHLPALSEGLAKVTPPAQTPYVQDSSQNLNEKQSSQLSAGTLPIPQVQQLPQISAPLATMPFNDAFTLPAGPQTNVITTSNFLAAFLQSTLKSPGQVHQSSSESLASSFCSPSEPTIQANMPIQGGPPLPSGPPPGATRVAGGQPISSAPIIPNLTSSLLAPAPLPLQPAAAPPRLMQPPLPPGPPPPSQQTSSVLQLQPPSTRPLSTSGSDLNSLLSSLVAHGVLSPAPSSASIPAQPMGVAPNVYSGILGLNPSSNTPIIAVEPSSKVVPPTNVVVSQNADARNHDSLSNATSVDDEGVASGFDGTEFKQDFLWKRHEFVIKALYSDFPRQCNTCGLRFKCQEEHSKHMDWHVSRNRRQKNSKRVS